MDIQEWKARKIAIVGAGAVGSTFAYALAQSGAADDIALIDFNQNLVKGQVLDLAHGLPFSLQFEFMKAILPITRMPTSS